MFSLSNPSSMASYYPNSHPLVESIDVDEVEYDDDDEEEEEKEEEEEEDGGQSDFIPQIPIDDDDDEEEEVEEEGEGESDYGEEEEEEEEEDDEMLETEILAEMRRCFGEPGKVGEEEEGPEPDASGSPSCPICFRPWTSCGPHRVCCLPCGHVHGRSCLEKWLQHCGETSGKCPQCCRNFRRMDIINLYAPVVVVPNDGLKKEMHSLHENNEILEESGFSRRRSRRRHVPSTTSPMADDIEIPSDEDDDSWAPLESPSTGPSNTFDLSLIQTQLRQMEERIQARIQARLRTQMSQMEDRLYDRLAAAFSSSTSGARPLNTEAHQVYTRRPRGPS